jgi:hypothetical protein
MTTDKNLDAYAATLNECIGTELAELDRLAREAVVRDFREASWNTGGALSAHQYARSIGRGNLRRYAATLLTVSKYTTKANARLLRDWR